MKKDGVVHLGAVDDIPVGQGLCFVVQGEEIAVFRFRDGKIFAIENKCPHRQGPLSEGVIGDGQVICPLHGHKFDLMTGQGKEPKECVRTYKICEDQGQMMLEFNRGDDQFPPDLGFAKAGLIEEVE